MLTNLRERSQRSFGVLILFGMLTFIFIFFFGPQSEGCQPQQASRSLDGWAARINGVELSQREVENIVYLRGDRRSEEELKTLRQEVLTNLVDQELLAQRAKSIGIGLDEQGLSRYITSKDNPDFVAFTDDKGNFDRSGFRDALRYRLGISPEDYRTRKRREFLADHYRRFLESQVQVSAAEVKTEVEKDLRSWNLSYLKFSPSNYSAADVTPDAVAQFKAANADDIKSFYEANKTSRFVKGREVKARRILIKKPTDDAGLKAARAKIEDLYKKAQEAGADFAALAEAHSEGAGDKEKKGDMGFVRPGAAFYKTVFEPLAVGKFSEIQDESIGFFFVKAEDEKAAINRTLTEATDEIATELIKSRAQAKEAKDAATNALAAVRGGASLESLSKPAPAADDVQPNEAPVEMPSEGPLPLFAETGPINDNSRFGQPWDRIPTLGKRAVGARSALVARRLRTLSEEKPLIDEVVELDGEFYVFSLKNKTEGTEAEIKEKLEGKKQQMLAQRRRELMYGEMKTFGGDPLSTFRKAIRAGQNIEINEDLYPTPKPQQASGLPPGIKLNLGGDK